MTDVRHRAVFIDRDGTLIEETGYLNDLSRLKVFPYSVDAVRQLKRAGFLVVVVTNQAGIARGIVPPAFLELAHRHVSSVMAAGGAAVDGYYHCPHHPDGIVPGLGRTCDCRKPAPGLWHRAAEELSIDLAASYTVGDRWLDVRAGRAAGTKTVLVRTGYGEGEESAPPEGATADAIVSDLAAAAGWILQQDASAASSPATEAPRPPLSA
jgi:D-glycero-D-manno-heptose 1,7-bisphosphate phosphatase